jgi:hypothetical protein
VSDPSIPTLEQHLSGVRAILWFNHIKYEEELKGLVDWRLTGNADITTYYKEVTSHPYFIKAKPVSSERVAIADPPTSLIAGMTYTLRLTYLANRRSSLVLNLLDDSRTDLPTWLTGTTTLVSEGSGESTVSITVPQVINAGAQYKLHLFLAHPNGEWQRARTDVKLPVEIITDSFRFIQIPTVFFVGRKATIDVAYTLAAERHPSRPKVLTVNILDPSNNWEFIVNSSVVLTRQRGKVSLSLAIPAHVKRGSRVVVDGFIAANSNDWQNASVKVQLPRSILVTQRLAPCRVKRPDRDDRRSRKRSRCRR